MGLFISFAYYTGLFVFFLLICQSSLYDLVCVSHKSSSILLWLVFNHCLQWCVICVCVCTHFNFLCNLCVFPKNSYLFHWHKHIYSPGFSSLKNLILLFTFSFLFINSASQYLLIIWFEPDPLLGTLHCKQTQRKILVFTDLII